ncbi:MAG: radical SAM family heme chaperone HemW [Gammaproteobacteria bacterium]
MFNFTQNPPLSLYVHVPWCVHKCPYCDFNSHEVKNEIPERAYVDALITDLEILLPEIWGRSVVSLFIGGGTPSLLSPDAISRLLSAIKARIPLLPQAEITLEANPGSFEQEKFSEFANAGINRLSIGIQSFDNELLRRLQRIHDQTQAFSAIEIAHRAGFKNINLDLMYGLPGQTIDQAIFDIERAAKTDPSHISHYQLTIEPNTLFHTQPPTLPDEDCIWAMQLKSQQLLQSARLEQYEVSAYATSRSQCIHNLNYWTFGDYIGIGAGAHSKLTSAQKQNITRHWRVKHPADYIKKTATATVDDPNHISGTQTLSRANVCAEFMMNALRLTSGFSPNLFFHHTGMPISTIEQQLKHASNQGLLDYSVDKICPTALGFQFHNDLIEIFIAS